MVAPIPNISGRKKEKKTKTAGGQSLTWNLPLEGNAMRGLAEGIVHDFNNLLHPIIGYTEITLNNMPEGSQSRSNLEEVLRAAGRAQDLVRQFLSFGFQGDNKLKAIQIQLIIDEAIKFLKATQPDSIEIRKHVDKKCGRILADPTQIHRVIMNLCINACHAMQQSGGVLEVALREVHRGSDHSHDGVMTSGKYLHLMVRDKGQGIDSSVIDRIFSPFFTTKQGCEGAGLGLFVVLGIVRSYGGHVSVSSEQDKGTAVNVYLPRIETEQQH